MNRGGVEEFLKEIQENARLRKDLLSARDEFKDGVLSPEGTYAFILEKLIPIASLYGFDFTVQEYISHQLKQESEYLMDEQLEAIIGGGNEFFKKIGIVCAATMLAAASFAAPYLWTDKESSQSSKSSPAAPKKGNDEIGRMIKEAEENQTKPIQKSSESDGGSGNVNNSRVIGADNNAGATADASAGDRDDLIERLRAQIRVLEREITSRDQQILVLRGEAGRRAGGDGSSREVHASDALLRRITEERDAALRENARLRGESETLRRENARLTGEVASLQAAARAAVIRAEAAEAERDTLRARVTALENDLAAARRDLASAHAAAAADVVRLTAERDNARRDLAAAQAEVARLNIDLAAARRDLAAAEGRERAAIAERDAANARAADAIRERDAARADVARLTAELDVAVRRVAAAEAQVAALGRELARARADHDAALESARAAQQAELARLRGEAERARAVQAARIAALEGRVSDLQGELDGVRGELARATERADAAEARVVELERRAADAAARVSELEVTTAPAAAGEAKREVTTVPAAREGDGRGDGAKLVMHVDGKNLEAGRIAALETKLEQARAERDAEQQELAAAKEQLVAANGEVDRLTAKNASLTAERDAARDELARARAEHEAALAAATAQAEAELERLRRERDAAIAAAAASQAERIAGLEGQIAAKEAELAEVQGKLADAEAKVAELERRAADAEARVSELEVPTAPAAAGEAKREVTTAPAAKEGDGRGDGAKLVMHVDGKRLEAGRIAADLEAELAAARAEHDEAIADRDKAKRELAAANAEVARLTAEKVRLTADLAAERAELARARRTHDAALARLREEARAAAVVAQAARIRELDARIRELQGELEGVQGQLAAAEKRAEDAEARAEAAKGALAEANAGARRVAVALGISDIADGAALGDILQRIASTVGGSAGAEGGDGAGDGSIKGQLVALASTFRIEAGADASIADLIGRIQGAAAQAVEDRDAATAQLAAANAEVARLRDEISSLTADLTAARDELAAARREHEEALAAAITRAEAELARLRGEAERNRAEQEGRIAAQAASIAALEARVSELQGNLEEVQGKLTAATARATAAEERVVELEAALGAANANARQIATTLGISTDGDLSVILQRIASTVGGSAGAEGGDGAGDGSIKGQLLELASTFRIEAGEDASIADLIGGIKEAAAQAVADRDAAREQLEAANAAAASLREANESLTADLAAERERIKTQEARIAELERGAAEAASAKRVVDEKIGAIRGEILEIAGSLGLEVGGIGELDIDALMKLSARIQEMLSDPGTGFGALRTANSTMTEELEGIRQELESIRELTDDDAAEASGIGRRVRISKLKAKVGEHGVTIARQTEELTAVRTQNTELQRRLEQLQAELETSRQTATRQQEEADAKDADMSLLRQRLAEFEARNAELQERLSAAERATAAATGEKTKAEGKNAKMRQSFWILGGHEDVAALREDMSDQAVVNQANTFVRDLNDRVNGFEARIAQQTREHEEALAALRAKMQAQMQAQIDKITSEKDAAVRTLETQKRASEEKDNELTRERQRVAELGKALDAQNAAAQRAIIDRLQAEKEQLEAKIAQLRKQHTEAETGFIQANEARNRLQSVLIEIARKLQEFPQLQELGLQVERQDVRSIAACLTRIQDAMTGQLQELADVRNFTQGLADGLAAVQRMQTEIKTLIDLGRGHSEIETRMRGMLNKVETLTKQMNEAKDAALKAMGRVAKK